MRHEKAESVSCEQGCAKGMSKLEPADERYEMRAREVLSRALMAGWHQADVFMKVAKVLRCEIGPLGIRRNEESDESGLALRVWRKDGTSAFIHADAVLERQLADLVPVVEPQSARGSRSLIPRLPSEDIERSHDIHEDGCEEGEIQDRARAIVAGFTAHRHVRVDLLQGRIASARIETINLNSAGGRVRFGQSIASIELQARGGPRGGGEPSFARYAAVTDHVGRLDPKSLVEEAAWRAVASCGGEPAPRGPVAAVMEPRASAQWVRSLVPRFIDHPSEGSGGGSGAGRIGTAKKTTGSAPSVPSLEGLTLLDDPLVSSLPSTVPRPALRVPFDGEGRRARLRVLFQDGVVVGRCIDSRDPEAPVDDLGPMRRDSYRDPPEPAPLGLILAPGASSRDELLRRMGKGLFVTSLSPWSKPGSGRLLAEVRGLWMEPGRGSRPIRAALLTLPDLEGISSLVGLGSDLEFDMTGLPVGCPSILFEGVDLLPL